jgi:hypothetical protein
VLETGVVLLEKPFTAPMLLAKVREVLGGVADETADDRERDGRA